MSAETLITDNLDLWTGAITKRITSGRGSNKKIELTGIHKLRHLILELACHGQIVPQLASETPACEVLEGLQLRRKELIRKRKIKNSKPLPNVSADEKPSKLPSNWVWTRLGSIAEISPRNCAEDATEASFVPMPLITTSYHGDHGHETKPWGKIKKGYTHFADGDVALAKITPCFENSKAAVFRGLINGLGAGTTELHVARPLSNAVNPYYLILFLKSPRFLIEGQKVMTGSAGQKRVPKDYFSSTPLPLPPTKEQHRIVQKVDELMALCDRLEQQTSDQIAAHDTLVDTLLRTLTQSQNATELVENWTRLAAHFDTLFTTEQSIDKLKQTILQLAVMGLLVDQGQFGESGIDQLGRISKAKMEKLAKGQGRKPKPLPPIDDSEIPFPLPQGWSIARLDDITDIQSGIAKGKKNTGKKTCLVPYLRVANVQRAALDLSEIKEIEVVEDDMERYLVTSRDLLITEGGDWDKVGRTAIWEGAISPMIHQNHVFRARLYLSDQSEDWIEKYLNSQFARSYFSDSSKQTTNLASINKTQLRSCTIPIPPPQEQDAIIKKANLLLSLCDDLACKVRKAGEIQLHLAETLSSQAISG